MRDLSNLLYIYLQKKLLYSINNISTKRSDEEDIEKQIELLKSEGRLISEIPFSKARQIINEYHNIPSNLTTPILYIMRDLKLLKIEGKFQSMKVQIINIHKGKLLSKPNKIYSICF